MTNLITTIPAKNDPLSFIERNQKLGNSTKLQYKRILNRALNYGVNFADSESVFEFAQTLPDSAKRLLKSALKLWSENIAYDAKRMATPENIDSVNAVLLRLDALNDTLTISEKTGEKTHTWLSRDQVVKMIDFTRKNSTKKSLRDRVVLSLLVGAGLRRDELLKLKFADIKTQPANGKVRQVLAITGKGNKQRTIPISPALAELLEQWESVCGFEHVALRVRRGDHITSLPLTGEAIRRLVIQAGEAIGLSGHSQLLPHDLRRTYARIGYDNNVPIEEISKLLGHADVKTTMRYLNITISLDTTISDYIPL